MFQQPAQQFFLALDIVIEAGLLHAEGIRQVLHRGVAVALFLKEAGGDLEELIFPGCFSLRNVVTLRGIYLPFGRITIALSRGGVKTLAQQGTYMVSCLTSNSDNAA